MRFQTFSQRGPQISTLFPTPKYFSSSSLPFRDTLSPSPTMPSILNGFITDLYITKSGMNARSCCLKRISRRKGKKNPPKSVRPIPVEYIDKHLISGCRHPVYHHYGHLYGRHHHAHRVRLLYYNPLSFRPVLPVFLFLP